MIDTSSAQAASVEPVQALVAKGRLASLVSDRRVYDRVRAATWHTAYGDGSQIRWTPPTIKGLKGKWTGFRVYFTKSSHRDVKSATQTAVTSARTSFPSGYPKVAVLTGKTVGPKVSASRIDAPIAWVALGDSYAAGDSAWGRRPGPRGGLTSYGGDCVRSDAAWAPQLVDRLGGPAFVQLSHPACTGATAADMYNDQLGTLGPSTDVVTLSIGGNDIGFGDFAKECVRQSLLDPDPKGELCQLDLAPDSRLAVKSMSDRVTALLREIRHRSPAAKIYLAGYPNLLPPAASITGPIVAGHCPIADTPVAVSLSFPADTARKISSELQPEMNAQLKDAAERAGAVWVDMSSATKNHWLSSTQPAITPISCDGFPIPTGANVESLHPNLLGQTLMTDAFQKRIDAKPAKASATDVTLPLSSYVGEDRDGSYFGGPDGDARITFQTDPAFAQHDDAGSPLISHFYKQDGQSWVEQPQTTIQFTAAKNASWATGTADLSLGRWRVDLAVGAPVSATASVEVEVQSDTPPWPQGGAGAEGFAHKLDPNVLLGSVAISPDGGIFGCAHPWLQAGHEIAISRDGETDTVRDNCTQVGVRGVVVDRQGRHFVTRDDPRGAVGVDVYNQAGDKIWSDPDIAKVFPTSDGGPYPVIIYDQWLLSYKVATVDPETGALDRPVAYVSGNYTGATMTADDDVAMVVNPDSVVWFSRDGTPAGVIRKESVPIGQTGTYVALGQNSALLIHGNTTTSSDCAATITRVNVDGSQWTTDLGQWDGHHGCTYTAYPTTDGGGLVTMQTSDPANRDQFQIAVWRFGPTGAATYDGEFTDQIATVTSVDFDGRIAYITVQPKTCDNGVEREQYVAKVRQLDGTIITVGTTLNDCGDNSTNSNMSQLFFGADQLWIIYSDSGPTTTQTHVVSVPMDTPGDLSLTRQFRQGY